MAPTDFFKWKTLCWKYEVESINVLDTYLYREVIIQKEQSANFPSGAHLLTDPHSQRHAWRHSRALSCEGMPDFCGKCVSSGEVGARSSIHVWSGCFKECSRVAKINLGVLLAIFRGKSGWTMEFRCPSSWNVTLRGPLTSTMAFR